MRIKTIFLAFLFFVTNIAQSQVKFRVKKLNADSLIELISVKEGTELIEVLNTLSNVICRRDIDSSINFATQAIELSEEIEYQKGLADGYFNVGNGYFLLDSLQPTISNYLKALRIYEDLDPTEEYGNLCMQINYVNYYAGKPRGYNYKNYSRQALHIYEGINDRKGQAMANLSIGSGKYVFSKEYDSAIYYHNKALSFLDPGIDQIELPYHYNEIGNIYIHQYREFKDTSYLSKALKWKLKALDLVEIADEAKAWVYYGIGNIYFANKTDASLLKAIEYYDKCNSIADSCFDAYDIKSLSYNNLGWTYYYLENDEMALFNFKQGNKLIEERLSDFSINDFKEPWLGYNSKYYLKVCKRYNYQGLYNIYYQLGDYKKAIDYYKLSKKAEEDIYLEKNQNLIMMMESISEEEKTKKQMALLAKENELKELTIKQSRIYLFALSGFILILFLIAVLLIRQRKLRTEHKIFIREQKLLHDLELKNVESEKLKVLDSMKSRFFANISHEFRTPLTLIKGPLERVLLNPEDKNILKELGVAKKYTGKLQVLINNLLTISKLESGKMELHASETDVIKLVGTYIQSFESLAKQKNITLNFKAREEKIKAFIDREKFEQVLNNLLSNAFKFTGEGGAIEVNITPLSPPLREENSTSQIDPADRNNNAPSPLQGGTRGVEIKISDTGRGIPPEHIDHIFDRFYQVGQENNSYYEGTGIGLALTKELVELHHGKIEVESEQGKGTTLTILLPLGKDHLQSEEVSQTKTEETAPLEVSAELLVNEEKVESDTEQVEEIQDTQPILLIVEDNTDMRSYIRGYFENEFSIIEAIDGEDGYKKSTKLIPDIIISDVMMPNMDGVEFCKKVKTDKRTSHIPVILLTARVSKESQMEGLETGADDFITKPFDGDELIVRVNNLIDQRKRLRAVLERKIYKSGSTVKLDFEDIEINSMDDQFLQKAKEAVESNLSNSEYSIEDFASALALSRSQLHRKLKALINSSGSEFINTIRMNYAIELLHKKVGTISEIAYDSGFNNPNYFSKIFRKKFGMSPSEYQNNIG